SDSTSTSVASAVPTLTFAPSVKPVPVMTTDVPPAVEPSDGSTFVTDGGVTYVYSTVADCLTPETTTSTDTAPAACAAVLAVISVSETTTTLVAAEPMVTVAPF